MGSMGSNIAVLSHTTRCASYFKFMMKIRNMNFCLLSVFFHQKLSWFYAKLG